MNKFKKGDRVVLSKKAAKWYSDHAFECCTVGGVLDNEKHAFYWLGMKVFGLGIPYKMKVLKQTEVTTYLVELKVGKYKEQMYVSSEDIRRFKL